MKIVVLTGCTRGLGRALAEYFSANGFRVVGCGRSAQRIAEMNARFAEHDFAAVDVANDAEVKGWAAKVNEAHGAPDLLINNAAVIAPNERLWELPQAKFDEVIDVNIKGTANVLRHFVPAMVNCQKGVIVNFSSGWGRSTSPEVAAYCASKWAIEGLTQSLAQELPAGMAAVALNPGIINTEMLRECFGAEAAHYPNPAEWVKSAGPFLAGLGAKDSGKALSVPGIPEA